MRGIAAARQYHTRLVRVAPVPMSDPIDKLIIEFDQALRTLAATSASARAQAAYEPMKRAMRASARVMTQVSYWV